jgi:hypothetical protein
MANEIDSSNQESTGGKWIQKAVSHPGAVKKAAKKHRRSVTAEAKAEAKSPNKKIAARGRLALRFQGKAKHGNLKKAPAKKTRGRKRVTAKR